MGSLRLKLMDQLSLGFMDLLLQECCNQQLYSLNSWINFKNNIFTLFTVKFTFSADIGNQIKSFILSLAQQIYIIVHEVGTYVYIIIDKLHRQRFPENRAYCAGLPSALYRLEKMRSRNQQCPMSVTLLQIIWIKGNPGLTTGHKEVF